MASINGRQRPDANSAYCSFKNDRARLLALVSRDVRLVLIAVVILAMASPGSVPLSRFWALLMTAL